MREKTWIVLPAYNAEKTLESTYFDIPSDMRSRIILVDDSSSDGTIEVAKRLGIITFKHDSNLGYGANQKSCYQLALEKGASIVVMLHPDHQYDPRVVGIMSDLIHLGNCDIVMGNRIRSRREALSGGMPKWRYFLNRISTLIEDLLLGQTLGDFHSGLRAYSARVLKSIHFESNSNDFAFDQEFLIQAVALRFRIAEIPIPVKYEELSSSISFQKSIKYGIVGAVTLVQYLIHRISPVKLQKFSDKSLLTGNSMSSQ